MNLHNSCSAAFRNSSFIRTGPLDCSNAVCMCVCVCACSYEEKCWWVLHVVALVCPCPSSVPGTFHGARVWTMQMFLCTCVLFHRKWISPPSPCPALHPHSLWLHSTRPLELSEARGGCSSLGLLSCVSEWALICVRVCVQLCMSTPWTERKKNI